MSTVHAVHLESVTPKPWRNGGGMQRDLLALPASQDWRVRVSIAEIERDGPFSSYPDTVRWFVVTEGEGVSLRFPRGEHRVTRASAPLRFDGAEAPACTLLAGKVRALNLMLRNAHGGIAVAADHRPWSPPAGPCGLYAAVDGVCHAEARRDRVAARTLIWYDVPPPVLRFGADADPGGPVGWWLQWSEGQHR